MTTSAPKTKSSSVLVKALVECRAHFFNAIIFSFFLNILSLAPTLYMLQVYSRVITTGGTRTLLYLTLILLFALGTMSMLDSLRIRLLMRSGLRVDKIIAGQVLNHLYARTASQRQGAPSQLLRDFDTFRQSLSSQGMIALFDLPWIVIFLGLCFYLNVWLGALTLGGGALLALVTWLAERSSYAYVTRSAEAMSKAYSRQDAVSQRADVVRALGMRQAMVTSQLDERHGAMGEQIHASLSMGRFSTLSKFLRQFLQSVALGVGAWLAINHQISAGAVFAASLLMSRTLMPMEQVINSWRSLIRAYHAFSNVDEALKEDAEAPVLTHLPPPEARLDVDNLYVLRQELRSYVLQAISFRVKPGELVVIAGPSGAGKSTLVRVLVGADGYDIGTVRYDGAERRDWDPERLAGYVGYLPQESSLFAGTVRDNISRFEAALGVDAEDIDRCVIEAAKATGLHDMILQLPNGYNTVLGPGGTGLSGGQSQRVALARALYRNPSILVLDEPNAFQDGAGEQALNNAITDVCDRGGSVIVVAHRTTLIDRAARMLILNGGRVQFFGTPKEWLESMNRPQGPVKDVNKLGNVRASIETQ